MSDERAASVGTPPAAYSSRRPVAPGDRAALGAPASFAVNWARAACPKLRSARETKWPRAPAGWRPPPPRAASCAARLMSGSPARTGRGGPQKIIELNASETESRLALADDERAGKQTHSSCFLEARRIAQ